MKRVSKRDSTRLETRKHLRVCSNTAAVLLQGTPQEVADAARQNIGMGGRWFILQPCCEVFPGTPEANIGAFCPCTGCLIPDLLRL